MADGRPAVLLDRDGTVMRDVGYPRDPADVELLPGAAAALRAFGDAGLVLVIVSNQSGVARGLITASEAAAVHARLVEVLDAESVVLDGAYYCFHGPEEGCPCRKPAPGLLLRAAADLGLELGRSVTIGDRERDLEAGRAAGCRDAILYTGDWDATAAAVLATA